MLPKTTQPTLINLLSNNLSYDATVSQHSVKIVKIPCHLKDMAFSIKCTLFLFSWKSGLIAHSIVFEYETISDVVPDIDDTEQQAKGPW